MTLPSCRLLHDGRPRKRQRRVTSPLTPPRISCIGRLFLLLLAATPSTTHAAAPSSSSFPKAGKATLHEASVHAATLPAQQFVASARHHQRRRRHRHHHHRHPTRLSGCFSRYTHPVYHHSHRHHHLYSGKEHIHDNTLNNSFESNATFPLRLVQDSHDGSLLVHHVPTNRTLRILPPASPRSVERTDGGGTTSTDHIVVEEDSIDNITDNGNTNNSTALSMDVVEAQGIAVQALVGVYAIPSGHVWIWIADSTPVYGQSSCPLGNHTTTTTIHNSSSSTAAPSGANMPLYHIRQATDLHWVHVPYQSSTMTTTKNRALPSHLLLTRAQQREERRQVALWRQAWKDHTWYFVPRRSTRDNDDAVVPDVTRSLQSLWAHRQMKQRQWESSKNATATFLTKNSTTTLPWYHPESLDAPDDRFFWNAPGLHQNTRLWNTTSNQLHGYLLDWAVPLTSAFCGVQSNVPVVSKTSTARTNQDNLSATTATQTTYDHLLFSRRSRWRAGTRFTKRGADALGRVANYVETEQVLVTTNTNNNSTATESPPMVRVYSHVQTRGSIPLRWSSPTDIKTYRPRVRMGTDPLAQARALQRHVTGELGHYAYDLVKQSRQHPSLVLVNLVDKHSDQGRLGRALEAVLQAVLDVYAESPDERWPALNPAGVRHVWFDFHAELKGGRWEKLQKLLKELQPTLMEHGYFQASLYGEGWRVEKRQTGVVRTNCMDCLDRTNVVQGIFARQIILAQLSRVLPLASKTLYRKNPLSLPWVDGEKAHRLVWADNADAISRLYAGTPALKGDFTRTGKRTKKGALDDGMNSLQRYYLNNFLDADRQEGIDLLTGQDEFNVLSEEDEKFVYSRDFEQAGSKGIDVKDAARQLLLGATWQDIVDRRMVDDESDHMRIKVPEFKARRSRKLVDLGLLWLPGDLQILMRELVAKSSAHDATMELASKQAVWAMDKRASSETPWWIQASSSSDDDETTPKGKASPATDTSTGTGFVLAAVVAISQAPLSTASIVLGILGTSLWNDAS